MNQCHQCAYIQAKLEQAIEALQDIQKKYCGYRCKPPDHTETCAETRRFIYDLMEG